MLIKEEGNEWTNSQRENQPDDACSEKEREKRAESGSDKNSVIHREANHMKE